MGWVGGHFILICEVIKSGQKTKYFQKVRKGSNSLLVLLNPKRNREIFSSGNSQKDNEEIMQMTFALKPSQFLFLLFLLTVRQFLCFLLFWMN